MVQKLELNRTGKEPYVVEVPDGATTVLDISFEQIFDKVYDVCTGRYKKVRAIQHDIWFKEGDEWVLKTYPNLTKSSKRQPVEK